MEQKSMINLDFSAQIVSRQKSLLSFVSIVLLRLSQSESVRLDAELVTLDQLLSRF
jgi:hypothetical protein